MFIISNLTSFTREGWRYIQCDFDVTEIESPFNEEKIWVAIKEENADMLTDEVYDPFVLVPLILGMYYRQDVYIDGFISPKLFHNIQHYIQTIFNNFSDKTSKIIFSVAGTKNVEGPLGGLIGASISCGVDSLASIYDNYILETMPDYKINSLFFFNCGTHGHYEDETSRKIWLDRAKRNVNASNDLGLPMYILDTNFHAFTHRVGEQKIGYLAIYSCVLAFQKVLRRYVTSSNLSYDEIADWRKMSRDLDIAEYCESYLPHLISTDRFELVIDGCQYTRAEKIERISDWPIAQNYLNVCIHPLDEAQNCSICEKCMWTLIPLEAIGKIDNFINVFNKDVYLKNSKYYKNKFVLNRDINSMESSIVDFCISKGLTMPGKFRSYFYILQRKFWIKIGRILRKKGLPFN